MIENPNPSDFSRNERDKNFTAVIRITGEIHVCIEAADLEDARRQADAEVERLEKDGCIEVDCVDEIALDRVRKDPPMFRVLRKGQPMQVSHLNPGNAPRAPDERGF